MPSLGSDQLRQRFSQTVALHKSDATPYVSVALPINSLGDSVLCCAVSAWLRKDGRHWERRVATSILWQQLPDTAGLYMFLWLPDLELSVAEGTASRIWKLPCVLYVGEAGAGESNNTLRNRYKDEYAKYVEGDPEQLWSKAPSGRVPRKELLQRYLTLFPLEYWFLEVDDPAKVGPLERRLLQMLNPPLIRQHRARLLGHPQPAF
jgi:hypothetical protein